LDQARLGIPDRETLKVFSARVATDFQDLSIKPTKLYPRRDPVEEENTLEFNKLTTEIYRYKSIDSQYYAAGPGLPDLSIVLKDLNARSTIQLRVGTQVMLLANLNLAESLVNGSRGLVIGFASTQQAVSQAQAKESGAEDEIRDIQLFSQGSKNMLFPKVQFENKKQVFISKFY
jgi:PIF1-like helicase